MLFTKKSDKGLQLCVDFQGLNAITNKNKHSLLLISILLNLFAEVKWYTKLDLIAAYNLLRIKHDNEWKTVF